VNLVDVDPKDIPNLREAHRGRVSYPLLKMFLESGSPAKRVDRAGIQQSLQGLTSCLTSYIRNHGLPIELLTRGGEIYLVRKDLNMDGTVNEAYVPPANFRKASPLADLAATEDIPYVDTAAVSQKFDKERKATTK